MRINLKNITLSEISQTQRQVSNVFCDLWKLQGKKKDIIMKAEGKQLG